jgi:hypothetical protein
MTSTPSPTASELAARRAATARTDEAARLTYASARVMGGRSNWMVLELKGKGPTHTWLLAT